MDRPGDISDGEGVFRRLLRDSHLGTAEHLTQIVRHAAAGLDARDVELLVVDHGQTELRALTPGARAFAIDDGDEHGPCPAFRRMVPLVDERADGTRLWVPIMDGLKRLGVLGLTFAQVGEVERGRAVHLASIVAELLVSKKLLSDSLHRAARREEMSLAAEMQWALMPPLTAGTPEVSLAAMLEPAYEVGGDLVDYSLEPGLAKVAVFDAVGHGIEASLLASLAVGSYRNRRRAGAPLPELAAAVDAAVGRQFDRRLFTTAVMATLDVRSGSFTWVNAGHPRPLLLRDSRVVKELVGRPGPPLGVGLLRRSLTVNEEQLQPGDRVLLYTDGVVEARTPGGALFGMDRLIDFIVRAEQEDEPIPETMRRLSHALLEHQGANRRDDATLMLVEWRTDASQGLTNRVHGPVRGGSDRV